MCMCMCLCVCVRARTEGVRAAEGARERRGTTVIERYSSDERRGSAFRAMKLIRASVGSVIRRFSADRVVSLMAVPLKMVHRRILTRCRKRSASARSFLIISGESLGSPI